MVDNVENYLVKVRITFYAYLLTRKYSKQYRDEIIAEFDGYVQWMRETEHQPEGVVVPFKGKAVGSYPDGY